MKISKIGYCAVLALLIAQSHIAMALPTCTGSPYGGCGSATTKDACTGTNGGIYLYVPSEDGEDSMECTWSDSNSNCFNGGGACAEPNLPKCSGNALAKDKGCSSATTKETCNGYHTSYSDTSSERDCDWIDSTCTAGMYCKY